MISLLKSKVKSIVKSINTDSFYIVQISKNLKYLIFSRLIDVNNAKELCVVAKECEDIFSILNS